MKLERNCCDNCNHYRRKSPTEKDIFNEISGLGKCDLLGHIVHAPEWCHHCTETAYSDNGKDVGLPEYKFKCGSCKGLLIMADCSACEGDMHCPVGSDPEDVEEYNLHCENEKCICRTCVGGNNYAPIK